MKSPSVGAWEPLLAQELTAPYYQGLRTAVDMARKQHMVYPPREREFFALTATPPEQVRVVLLGQDPYHGEGQAMGLAFSVNAGVRFPPSLSNIFRELSDDLGIATPTDGDLTPWAKQGVLLLNTVLTVEDGKANSHAAWGWQRFTNAVICATAALPQPIVYLLWGTQAQKKAVLLSHRTAPTLILTAPHPSPLSSYRGFFGSRPFSRTNDFLRAQGQAPICWSLP